MTTSGPASSPIRTRVIAVKLSEDGICQIEARSTFDSLLHPAGGDRDEAARTGDLSPEFVESLPDVSP